MGISKGKKLKRLKKQREDLLAQYKKLAKNMLQGSIVELYRSCGQKRCRCQRGEKHGPAYYLSRKEKGRTQMLYVKRDKIEQVKKQVEMYKEAKKIIGEICRINEKLLQEEQRDV